MSNKMYHPTIHAVERAVIRYSVVADKAESWFNTQMKKARYVTSQTFNGRSQLIYEYDGKRFVIDEGTHTIITVKPTPSKSSEIIKDVSAFIERKMRNMTRKFKRDQRALNIEIAELNIEVANLTLNKVKARSPKIQAIIQSKIDSVNSKVSSLKTELAKLTDDFENEKRGAQAWMD